MRNVLALWLLLASSSPLVRFGPNISVSGHGSGVAFQNETSIAANPKDPKNLVAVFQGGQDEFDPEQGCFFSFTTDGGKTWQFGGRVPQQKAGNFCSDPAIASDAEGNFYFSHLDVDFSQPGLVDFDVDVARSIDGGKTFSSFSIAIDFIPSDLTSPQPDKPYVAVDTGDLSPFKGSLYVGYTDFSDRRGAAIAVVVSQDGGSTWSTPVPVAEPQGNERFGIGRFGALPVVTQEGTVYVFYSEFPFTGSGPLTIGFTKSTDGGRKWSKAASVASNLPSPGFFMLKNASPDFGSVPFTGLFVNSSPTAAVAPDGTLFVAWTDFPNGSCLPDGSPEPPCSDSDVRLSLSRDAGTSWTAPVKISDETTGTDQFFPWIAAHPDGDLSLTWVDRRNDTDNVNYDIFYTRMRDGAHFLPNVRVSSATSLLGLNDFIGDYIGLAVSSRGIFPLWTDARSGTPQVFTARGMLP